MNEPMIILCDKEDGHPVRRFVDGDASHGGGAARQDGRGTRFLAPHLAQRALHRIADFGQAAAALTMAGFRLARRR